MLYKTGFSFLLLLVLSASLAFGTTITFFQASYDNSTVRVVWDAANESGVRGYDLYRKANNEAGFTKLTTLLPAGQARYKYLDANLNQGLVGSISPQDQAFTYRLTVRTTTGQQNYTHTPDQTLSLIQRSWSSIKSMFR